MSITILTLSGSASTGLRLGSLPDRCPYCHNGIRPVALYGFQHSADKYAIFMHCPNNSCKESFIAYYVPVNKNQLDFYGITSFGKMESKAFSEDVKKISESFEKIYNEAYAAEQQGYLEICGVGYRKALEFLIKDYAIVNHPTDKEKIEKKLLGPCIQEYVSSANIKSVAKRAVWLGNDETHYVRKWEGKNLQDLKKLIDLTIHWMEAEILTASFENDMPE